MAMAKRRESSRGRGWIKWIVGVVVALVVLIIVLVVVAPMLVPVDTVRAQITSAVKDATGRDLEIKGGLSVSVFPTLAVTAKDVTFSNAAWAGDKPMASLTKLDVHLRLLPLLSKRIEISSFVLDKPSIDLQTDKNGHGNWEFNNPAAAPAPQPGKTAAPKDAPKAATKPADSSGSGGMGGIGGIALGDVHISDGHLTYRDGVTGKTETIDALNLKIALADMDSPLKLDGSAKWHDKAVQLTLDAAKPNDLMSATGSKVGLKLTSDPIKLAFTGSLAMTGSPKADGDVDLSIASIRDLAAWATGKPLTMPGDGLGPFALKGKASVNGAKYGLGGVQLSLDSIKATGDFTVDTGGARPSLKGKLAVDKLDLNHYMAPEGKGAAATDTKTAAAPNKTAAPANTSAQQQGWSDEPIDASGLKAADLNLALAADSILYRKVEVGKTNVQITLDNGKLALDLTDMALYQGSVKGQVKVDGSAAVLGTDFNLKIDKVQVGPLLKAMADNDRVTGAAVIDTQLTSHGKSQRELVSALNGKGTLALQNGVVKGIDLVGLIKNAASSLVGGKDGETAFTTANGTYVIANGILTNKDLKVAAPQLSASGQGTVDLPKRTVDYKLTASVVSTVAVPVNVTGPWDNISWGVDLVGLATQNAGNAVKLLGSGAKGLGDTAGSAAGGTGDALKGIGKKLFGK